ncbi:MAG: hypothetical protein JKY46_11030 [Robiginitomaculum sp.]|nr:hypothetical protein [Robiginitomaculum sp.]
MFKSGFLKFGWLSELALERSGIRAKRTGALISWNWDNFVAVFRGAITHIMLRLMAISSQLVPGRNYTIAFTPQKPSPWYLIWGVIIAGKGRITKNPYRADALFHFCDETNTADLKNQFAPETELPELQINANCTDVSKTRVEQVFEQIFGYALSVDPKTWNGLAVEKSDENGTHDGRVVQCPMAPVAGKVYEKLLVNSDNGSTVLDYRSVTIGGQIALVFIKQRPMNHRFANFNTKVELVTAKSVFTPDELLLLSRFCAAMNLDFGGLDVLRNREDGKIYVVDVNKTDMGPPISLGFYQQFKAMHILAKAFREFIIIGDKSKL